MMKPETNARREALQVRISSLLQTRGYEMFQQMSPAFMQKADLKVKKVYVSKKDKIRNDLMNLRYFLAHARNLSRLSQEIADELREIMTNEIKEMMEITVKEQNDIDVKMSDLVVIIESDLKLLFGEAETRFTKHEKKFSVDKDPDDDLFMIVKITEDIIDPWGTRKENVNSDTQRFPVNQVYDTRSWYQKVGDWFSGLFD